MIVFGWSKKLSILDIKLINLLIINTKHLSSMHFSQKSRITKWKNTWPYKSTLNSSSNCPFNSFDSTGTFIKVGNFRNCVVSIKNSAFLFSKNPKNSFGKTSENTATTRREDMSVLQTWTWQDRLRRPDTVAHPCPIIILDDMIQYML